MPKFKPHTGTAKRVTVTGSGRLRREHAGKRHLLEKKPSTLTRRLSGTTDVSGAEARRVKRLLGR